MPPNPLPETLTRLLDATAERPIAPTPGDHRRGEPPPTLRRHDDHLDGLVVRSLALAITVLLWLGILWLIVRHIVS